MDCVKFKYLIGFLLFQLLLCQDQSLSTWQFDTTAISLQIIPDQNIVLVGSLDYSVKMFNLSNPAQSALQKFIGHSDTVNDIISLPNSDYFFTVSNDTTIIQWDINGPGEPMKIIQASSSCIFTIAYFSQLDLLIAAECLGKVTVWDYKLNTAQAQRGSQQGHILWVTSLLVIENTTLFVSAGLDQKLILWNITEIITTTTKITPQEFNGLKNNHTSAIGVISHIQGTTLIVSCGADKKIQIWDYTTRLFIREMLGHTDTVFGVYNLPFTNYIASWSSDHTVRLWNYSINNSNNLVLILRGHDLQIFRGQNIHGTSQFLTLSFDNSMKLWDVYQCEASCKTCKGAKENGICTSCPEFTFRSQIPINGKCDCLDGYFEIGNIMCSVCSSTCQTCSEHFEQCTSCPIDRYMDLTQNQCLCPQGKFALLSNPKCLDCSKSCKTCADNSEKCTSCSKDMNRNDLSQLLYQCPCIESYFSDESSNCQQCHHSCSLCDGPLSTNCLACPLQSFRIYNDATKSCDCQTGYFEQDNVCQKCGENCSSCVGSENNCLKCRGTSRMPAPICNCPLSTYHLPNQDDCQKCLAFCESCQNVSSCTQCASDRIYQKNICSCPPGKFETSIGCINQCQDDCELCGINAGCSCYQGLLLQDNKCVATCKNGFFKQRDELLCSQCYDNCLSCVGSGNQQCTACKKGFVLENRTCRVQSNDSSQSGSQLIGIILGVVLPVMFLVGLGLVCQLRKSQQITQGTKISRKSNSIHRSVSQSQSEQDQSEDRENQEEKREGDYQDDEEEDNEIEGEQDEYEVSGGNEEIDSRDVERAHVKRIGGTQQNKTKFQISNKKIALKQNKNDGKDSSITEDDYASKDLDSCNNLQSQIQSQTKLRMKSEIKFKKQESILTYNSEDQSMIAAKAQIKDSAYQKQSMGKENQGLNVQNQSIQKEKSIDLDQHKQINISTDQFKSLDVKNLNAVIASQNTVQNREQQISQYESANQGEHRYLTSSKSMNKGSLQILSKNQNAIKHIPQQPTQEEIKYQQDRKREMEILKLQQMEDQSLKKVEEQKLNEKLQMIEQQQQQILQEKFQDDNKYPTLETTENLLQPLSSIDREISQVFQNLTIINNEIDNSPSRKYSPEKSNQESGSSSSKNSSKSGSNNQDQSPIKKQSGSYNNISRKIPDTSSKTINLNQTTQSNSRRSLQTSDNLYLGEVLKKNNGQKPPTQIKPLNFSDNEEDSPQKTENSNDNKNKILGSAANANTQRLSTLVQNNPTSDISVGRKSELNFALPDIQPFPGLQSTVKDFTERNQVNKNRRDSEVSNISYQKQPEIKSQRSFQSEQIQQQFGVQKKILTNWDIPEVDSNFNSVSNWNKLQKKFATEKQTQPKNANNQQQITDIDSD